MENKMIRIGFYKHFKGGEVEVLGVGKHSETHEDMVFYKHTDQGNHESDFWVRPMRMFLEEVPIEGEHVPRFKYLHD